MLPSPINNNEINNGIDVIITNPVDTPFNTSIVLIVFAVTGIDTNINNGYIIDNLIDPKNRKSKFGSYAPNIIIGTDANNKIKGFFLPPNDLKSSTIPIVAEPEPETHDDVGDHYHRNHFFLTFYAYFQK